jgi:uncharacterized membrane protein
MDTLFNTFLVLHILGGAAGLITGTINIINKKGDKTHKRSGNVFFYAMLIAGFSALVLSAIHPNHFLFIVGVFTIYMTATGKRYLFFKQTEKKPRILDWALAFGMLLAAVVFIILGSVRLANSENFGIVFIVFGIIGIRFFRTDLANYRGKSTIKNYWLTGHLQRMTGSYAAAMTAFLVVNGKYMPAIIPSVAVWLLPTAVLVPLIIKWTRKYKKELPSAVIDTNLKVRNLI